MPKQYEAIRDKFASQGMDYDEAQGRAAAIYNAKHPGAPVTGRSEGAPKKRKRKKKAAKSNFDYMKRKED